MPAVPTGYARIVVPLRHTLVPRGAAMVFGVNIKTNAKEVVAQKVYASMTATGSFLSRLDSDVTLGPVQATVGTELGEEQYNHPFSSAGTRGASSVYAGVAVLVRKNTASLGKKHRGRFFLPWFTGYANINEAGVVVATDVALTQTALNTWMSNLDTTQAMDMVILHGDTTPPTRVQSLTVDPLLSSQRRRYGR